MSPNDRKLTFQLVEAALEVGDDNVHCHVPMEDVKRLEDLKILEKGGKRLLKMAFSEYLTSFESLSPPREIEYHAPALFAEKIYWRKPIGKIKNLMSPQHRGKSLPLFATVFIGKHADLGTWFHELGHLVYGRLTKEEMISFAKCVHEHGSILRSDGSLSCADPGSGAMTLLPPGKYLALDRLLLGLDHSGTDEDAVNDECWAAIFGLIFTNVPIPAPIADAFDAIIQRLYAR